MDRITKVDLEQLVEVIADEGYFIEYTSGRPRLYLEVKFGRYESMASGEKRQQVRVEEVSPRLSAREMSEWLNGFIKGLGEAVGEEEEEEVYDNPSYRGYYIYPDLMQQHWYIQKGGHHIGSAPSEEEAQRVVDDLLDD